MPGWLDVTLVLAFAAAWPVYELLVGWPQLVRDVERGDPMARRRAYQETIALQWLFVAATMAITLAMGRSLDTVGLHVPEGWRLWLGVGLPLAYTVLGVAQLRQLAAKPEALVALRTQLTPLKALLAHTRLEWRWFTPLAVTAGICEELLFRGYLVWVLGAWLGVWVAASISVVSFGLAHAYQGRQFGVRAFLAGVVMGALALATGSVLPGMVLHAVVDLTGGYAGYLALRAEPARAEDGVAA